MINSGYRMINRCDDCIHSKVCIYKQRYHEIYETLKNESKYDEPFSVELECKEYKTDILTGHIKDFNILSPLNFCSKSPDSCEGCSIYDDIKRSKTIINDACSFCSKSPIRVGD